MRPLALAVVAALALAACNPCRQAQSKLCAGPDPSSTCGALKTLVEASSDDVSCKQLLDAARARDSKESGAEVAFAAAAVAVTAAAVAVDLKSAQKKLQETFSK